MWMVEEKEAKAGDKLNKEICEKWSEVVFVAWCYSGDLGRADE